MILAEKGGSNDEKALYFQIELIFFKSLRWSDPMDSMDFSTAMGPSAKRKKCPEPADQRVPLRQQIENALSIKLSAKKTGKPNKAYELN
jgi:hypothetical protein